MQQCGHAAADKQTHRRAWPQYILRRLRLTQNVIINGRCFVLVFCSWCTSGVIISVYILQKEHCKYWVYTCLILALRPRAFRLQRVKGAGGLIGAIVTKSTVNTIMPHSMSHRPLAERTRQTTEMRHVVTCMSIAVKEHFRPLTVNFDLWPWPSNLNLHR